MQSTPQATAQLRHVLLEAMHAVLRPPPRRPVVLPVSFTCCGELQYPLTAGLWDRDGEYLFAICQHCGRRALYSADDDDGVDPTGGATA